MFGKVATAVIGYIYGSSAPQEEAMAFASADAAVEAQNGFWPATGYYLPLLPTGEDTVKLYYGNLDESLMDEVEADLRDGIVYTQIKEQNKIAESYAEDIIKNVLAVGSDWTTVEISGSTQIWQWVVLPSDSNEGGIRTDKYFDRTGSNRLVPPACPWSACADAECTTCTDDWKA